MAGDWHPYLVADVFTDTPLEGNQLGVFPDADDFSPELMQAIARELRHPETIFLLAPDRPGADARVRIFTPAVELPFAGHPVLGAAFVVGLRNGTELVRLQTGAGVVPIALTRDGDGEVAFGEMEQPIPTVKPFGAERELLDALGIEHSELPVESYRNGPLHVYVTLESVEQVAALRPDLGALADLGELGVSCFALDGAGVKTRMFAPAMGVPEDPATGSAAGPLALHLARHGWIEFGATIEIRQGVEINRPALLYARVEGSRERVERILVGGSAVIVARGEYRCS